VRQTKPRPATHLSLLPSCEAEPSHLEVRFANSHIHTVCRRPTLSPFNIRISPSLALLDIICNICKLRHIKTPPVLFEQTNELYCEKAASPHVQLHTTPHHTSRLGRDESARKISLSHPRPSSPTISLCYTPAISGDFQSLIKHTTMPAIPFRDSSRQLPPNAHSSPSHHITSDAAASIPQPLHPRTLQSRQSAPNQVAIPAIYSGLNTGPPPGTVVGIVLGSVLGFILLVWLFSALSGNNSQGSVVEEDVVVRRSRSPRSKRSRRSEMTSRSPRPDRVIRQERIIRDTSRGPPRDSFRVTEEVRTGRRVDGDDIVEVIEEEASSVAPRRKSKRGGSRYG